METANIELPVYLIGSQFDGGTVEAAFKQFEGRDEFCLSMIDDVKDARGKPDRWQTVKRCVKKAIEAQEDLFVLCESDHIFTAQYHKDYLIRNIIEAHGQGCNILCGGVASFQDAVPLSRNRYWVDSFMVSSFTIIYVKFYQNLLDEPGTENLTLDQNLSKMTSHKMTLYPFISVRNYPKSGGLGTLQCEIMYRFTNSGMKLKIYQEAYDRYILKNR